MKLKSASAILAVLAAMLIVAPVLLDIIAGDIQLPLGLSFLERTLVALGLLLVATVLYRLGSQPVLVNQPTRRGRQRRELVRAPQPMPLRRISDRGREPIIFGSAICAIFFGVVLLWGAFAPIESAAVGPAVIRVQSDKLSLDHPDGGRISELLVKEGERVANGQVLFRLDTSDLTTRLRILMRRRDTLLTLRARLLAEQKGEDTITYPEKLVERAEADFELAGMIANQNSLFEADGDAFLAGTEVHKRRITQLEELIKGLQAQLTALTRERKLIEKERASAQEGAQNGSEPQTRELALERESARLEGRIGSLQADIAETRAQIGEARLSVVRLRRDKLTKVSEKLRSTFAELAELEPRIDSVLKRLARTELRAPTGGIITGANKILKGTVIKGGEPILHIEPEDKRLVVEARIRPIDRDVVFPGMRAKVRLGAFNFRETEPVPGEVLRISPDAITDESTGQSYYIGVIELKGYDLAADRLGVQPGMRAEVIIPLTTRTPLQYLIEPLVRNWRFAMRET